MFAAPCASISSRIWASRATTELSSDRAPDLRSSRSRRAAASTAILWAWADGRVAAGGGCGSSGVGADAACRRASAEPPPGTRSTAFWSTGMSSQYTSTVAGACAGSWPDSCQLPAVKPAGIPESAGGGCSAPDPPDVSEPCVGRTAMRSDGPGVSGVSRETAGTASVNGSSCWLASPPKRRSGRCLAGTPPRAAFSIAAAAGRPGPPGAGCASRAMPDRLAASMCGSRSLALLVPSAGRRPSS